MKQPSTDAAASPHRLRRQLWFLSGLLALVVVLAFAGCLDSAFVWDDEQFVLKNVFLTSWRFLPQLLTRNIVAGAGLISNLYRPLESLTHFLDVRLWGYHPWGHHLTNVLGHAALAVVLFRLLATLFPAGPAVLAATLFALHPLHVEAVAYVSGRGDTLAMLWLCLGLLAAERHRGWALVCAALAMASKESLALFPVFLLLYELAAARPISIKRHLPFWALAGGYVALRLTVLNFSNTLNFYQQPNVLTEHWPYRFYTYLSTLPKGVSLWLWPVDLHHERSWPVFTSTQMPQVWHGALLVLLLCGVIWMWWRRWRPAAVGLGWFVIATAPTSNLFVLINALFYDHWFLLPGLGLTLVVGQALTSVSRMGVRWRQVSTVIAAALVLCCALWTVRYSRVWRTSVSLYAHILRWEPASAKMSNNLGMAYADAGQTGNAMFYYRRAIALSDEYPQTHHNLGNLYELQGEDDRAIEEFQRAVAMDPRFHHAWIRLGALQLKRRHLDEAAASFAAAIRAYPYAPEAYLGLAQTHLAAGQPQAALDALAAGRRVLPDAGTLEAAERKVRALVSGAPNHQP